MIQETLREAIQKHQQGDLATASSLYLKVLQYEPENVDALGLMSLIAETKGDHDMAIELASRAIQLKPKRVEFYINLANPLIATAQIDRAIETLEKAVKVDRRSVDVLSTLGDAYQKKGDYDTAIEFYHRGLKLDRSDPILYNNLGNALQQLASYEESISYYQKALSLNSEYADAYYNLGISQRLIDQQEEAAENFKNALKHNPKNHLAHYQMGQHCYIQRDYQTATKYFQDALRYNPNPKENFDTLMALGDLSNLYQKHDAAEDCYRTALKLKPDHVDALARLAYIAATQNQIDEARRLYEQLIEVQPENFAFRMAHALCIPIFYDSVEAINTARSGFEATLDSLADLPITNTNHAKTAFYLSYHGQNNRPLMEKMTGLLKKHINAIEYVSPIQNAKPKIGFISAFHHESHTIGKLTRGLIRNLSRDLFDVVILSVGEVHKYNKGETEHPADEFIDLPEDVEVMRQIILEQNLDVLFYLDIGMDSSTYTLAFNRLAKVQCVTWGHPDTTGLKTIDYFISSELIESDDADEHYTEELVRLKYLPVFYYRPPHLDGESVKGVLGISESETIYACPQSIYKLHPEFDTVLAEILRRDPNGRIVLLSSTSEHSNKMLMERFEKNMPDVFERVMLVQRLLRPDFLNLLAAADVMLDPMHFGGGNTTFEALSYGTPIVTLPGEFMRGRVTSGCYHQMGYTELIANTSEEYAQIAVRLGTNPEERKRVRKEILAKCDVLYESHAAIRELEQFFLNALERAKQGGDHA